MRIALAVLTALSVWVAGGGCAHPSESLRARALRIQREAPLVDGHNDLPWEIRKEAGGDLAKMDFCARLNSTHTDLPRLKAGGVGGVFFAAYLPYSAFEHGMAARMTIEQIDLIHRMVEHAPNEMEFARTADDVVRIHRQGKIA